MRQLGQCGSQAAILQVDYKAIRTAERENVVLHRLAEIQHDASLTVLGPDADILNRAAGISGRAEQQEQGY